MRLKKSDLTKAITLIEQKKQLQKRLTKAIQLKKTFSIRLIQIQIVLLNQKWRKAAVKLCAGNDATF
jgi:hypothetical protein